MSVFIGGRRLSGTPRGSVSISRVGMSRSMGLVALPRVAQSDRGTLTVLECTELLPFPIERVFWVHGIAKGATRGAHANWRVQEGIACMVGSVRITLHDGHRPQEFVLDSPDQLLYVPAGTWIDIVALTDGSSCLVVADATYEEARAHYVHDFTLWQSEVLNRAA